MKMGYDEGRIRIDDVGREVIGTAAITGEDGSCDESPSGAALLQKSRSLISTRYSPVYLPARTK